MTGRVWKRKVAALMGVLVVRGSVVLADLNTGLVAYYPFDENANDASGNGNDGVIFNASFVAGQRNLALSFQGSSASYVEVPHNDSLTPSNAVTLSAWIMVCGYPTWHSGIIYKAGENPTSSGFKDRCYTLWVTSNQGFHISATPPGASSQIAWSTPGSLYALNEWFHAVGIVDAQAQEFRVYVNGSVVGTASYSANAIRGGNLPLRIGCPFFTLSDQSGLNGVLDDVRIYNRALSAAEVQELYSLGGGVMIPANANIYGAGHASAPAPGGGGGGVLPTLVSIPAGTRYVTFGGLGGTVLFGSGSCGPEGWTQKWWTDLYSYGGVSGMIHSNRVFFLSGVFLDGAEPIDPAPARLIFDNSSMGFTEIAPVLRQTFFIGDGLSGTGSGSQQRFRAPTGATRLYLGFHDGDGFLQMPGYYGDNSGQLSGTVNLVSDASAAVSNVRAAQHAGTKLVDIFYDLTIPVGTSVNVAITVSTNDGASYSLPASSFSRSGYGAGVTPGLNRQITWDAGADWNNQLSSQVKFRVTADGAASADSATITVDTRNGNRPVVQDVRSAYCWGIAQSGRHAYFLNGVSLNQTFAVVPDWNGKTPGSIKFIGLWGTHTQSGTETTRTYNVGAGFGVGGTLTVVLVASDGTKSWPYPVNFDVIPLPPIVGPLLYLGSVNELLYRTPSFDLDIFDGRSGTIPGALASRLPGETMEVSPMFKAEAVVDGSGVLTIDAVGGKKGEVKLNGTQNRRPDGRFGKAAAVDFGLGIQGELQLKYAPSTGQWLVDAGSLGLDVFGEFASAPIYVYAPPPIYFRYEIGAEVFFGVAVSSMSSDGLSSEFFLSTERLPEIRGIVGCGVSKLLAVEGYAALAGKMEVTAPPLAWNKLGIGGKIGVELVVIGWGTGPIDIYSGTAWIIGGPTNRFLAPPVVESQELRELLNRLDPRAFRPLSRGYLEASTRYSTFLTANTVRPKFWGDPSSPGVPLLLQTNIYPYSEPALAVSGTNRLLLLVTDNTNRAPENRTELIWSKWNGSTWLNPTSVWDDATADFSPVVQLFPNGSALAVWANEKAVLTNGAPLDTALAGLEIAAARFDPETGLWTAGNLTSNDYLDHSPQLAAAANGQALLIWIQNTNNSVLGATNALNIVQSRFWDGANWQDTGTIGPDPGMVLWSTVAYDGTNGVFLAAIDPDDDQPTIADQELWGATFDGASWTALAQLTTNTVQDTKPQAVYDSAGRLLVVWYQNTNLVMRVGDLDLGSPTVVGQLSGASSQKDFHLVTGPAGQISAVWEDLAADGSGPDPMLLNYDAALGVWSEPLRLLANTNQLERSFSGAYADNGALLLAYNSVAISYDTNNVPQFGAVDLMFLDYQIGSDLAVNSSDIGLSTNNPAPGQSVDLTALVRNTGELAATNVQVAFYDGNPASGGSLIGSTQTVAGVFAAGSNVAVQVAWVVPQTTTNRVIYVVVDPAQAQPDRNRADNTASKRVLAADLQISDITVLQSSATNRIINARCVNTGVIPSGTAVDVVFRRWATNGPVLATVPIANLPTNGMYDASFEWKLSELTFTNAFELVYVTVDAGHLVSEADEDNNARVVQVMTALDSDSDGLLDGEEARYGANPQLPDTDSDGLKDGEEVNTYHTDPTKWDTDGDGISDRQEVLAGTDPNSMSSVFKITSVQRNPDGSVVLQWSSVTNKVYRVNRSLMPSRGGYTTLTNGMPGAPPVNTFTDTAATNATAFYWIEVQ